jgi:tRNA wybutosine-synthesizing protein 4
MANVLCQIRGSKRLLLFPPSDVQYFDFAPGASSSNMDVFQMCDDSQLGHTHPYEAILNPGDVLFIPPFWLHTARPIDGVSINVNVFFRSLQTGYAAGRDVYGNRDLQAYEKGRQDVSKLVKSFNGVPADVRNFYLQRLAAELGQRAGPRM